MPELRELRVFIAVAERLSFTRAAEHLHLAQQTVSRTIKDLERELGVELLERTSREVVVTAAGMALLESGREAVRAADDAFTAARAVGTGRRGTVWIGVTPAIGPDDRAAVIAALRRDSERSIALRDLRPGELGGALGDRVVDLALASANGVHSPGIDHAQLRPSTMQVFVSADHPLAGCGSATLSDFDGHRLLVASPPGTPFTDLLLERFAAGGAAVIPVEARVTGGAHLLTELMDLRTIAAMPSGTAWRAGVAPLQVAGFRMPLAVLWRAGRPPEAVAVLRRHLGSDAGWS